MPKNQGIGHQKDEVWGTKNRSDEDIKWTDEDMKRLRDHVQNSKDTFAVLRCISLYVLFVWIQQVFGIRLHFVENFKRLYLEEDYLSLFSFLFNI